MLRASVSDDNRSFARFRREAEISSRLGHPNIIEVFDFNRTDDGQAYFVMELLEGRDLAAELRAGTALPLRRVMEILDPVASALSAAHAAGVIHRDLKPSNIFLGQKGAHEIIKVLDFGVSKVLGALDLTSNDESLIGTPAYMSPEQARGQAKEIDARSDQFSLASIAYEMVSGSHPFKVAGSTPFVTLYKIQKQDPPPLDGVPPPLAAALHKALAKAPEERFADVAAFAAALRESLGAPATGAAPAVRRAPARRRTVAIAGGVVALVGAAATAIVVRHAPAPPQLKAAPVPEPVAAAPLVLPVPAPARLSLSVSPPQARVVWIAADGTQSATLGPWPAGEPRLFSWPPGQRPRSAHVEADGYEPAPVALPDEGTTNEATVRLVRRPPPKRGHPKSSLPYPWPNR